MNDNSLISQIGTIIATLLGIAVILYLAYISTKLIGKRFSVKSAGGKKLRIIESISIGKGETILIVKAGNKTFLVGAAPECINLLSELDSEEFTEIDSEQPPESGMDFKTAFKAVLEKNFGKKNKKDKENKNDSSQTK